MGEEMIRLNNVKKVYTNSKLKITALKQANLEIHSGEIYGIIGYSGAGKSTLIRLINMLESPTSGEIWIANQRMDKLSQPDLRKSRQEIGMIFQHFNLLWSRTVSENIAFPLEIAKLSKKEIDQRVFELIDLVGLTDKADVYPSELSGGQKQRVGIARALANRPKVLLSDEATSALDPKTTDSILALLQDINRKLGITIILITHEMHVIWKICNRVAIIDTGEIVEEGPVLDVFTNPSKEITKEFVKQVSEYKDTEETINHFPIEEDSHILKCSFVGDKTNQPIISKWVKTLDVEANILEGKIQYVQGSSYGSLYIQINANNQVLKNLLIFSKSMVLKSRWYKMLDHNELVLLLEATIDTLYMVGISGLLTVILGTPLGIFLVLTDKGQLLENKLINIFLSIIVNIFRSIPFIILMVLLIPVTRQIVGTTIGPTAATVPLIVGAAPFFARLVETSLREVNKGVIEAAISVGANVMQIVRKVYLPEALPSIFSGITVTLVALISYSAMAGVVGGGGLGNMAIIYGYQLYNMPVMFVTTGVILILVQLVQSIGEYISKRIDKK